MTDCGEGWRRLRSGSLFPARDQRVIVPHKRRDAQIILDPVQVLLLQRGLRLPATRRTRGGVALLLTPFCPQRDALRKSDCSSEYPRPDEQRPPTRLGTHKVTASKNRVPGTLINLASTIH